MNFAALFAIQGNSVPFLGTCIAHVSFVSPFGYDQHWSHQFFRFLLAEESTVHRHGVPHVLRAEITPRPMSHCHTPRRPIQSLRPPCPPHPTVQLNVIHVTFRAQRTVAHELAFTMLITKWSYGFCSLGPVFQAHSSCHQKFGLLQSNVTCALPSHPFATWLIASPFMG